jgi:hypothetical protein
MRKHQLTDLLKASDDLVEIIEGMSSAPWRCRGERLNATPQWIAFYVALDRLKRHNTKVKPMPSFSERELSLPNDAA